MRQHQKLIIRPHCVMLCCIVLSSQSSILPLLSSPSLCPPTNQSDTLTHSRPALKTPARFPPPPRSSFASYAAHRRKTTPLPLPCTLRPSPCLRLRNAITGVPPLQGSALGVHHRAPSPLLARVDPEKANMHHGSTVCAAVSE